MTLREFAEWLSNLQGYERQNVTLTRIMQEARDALASSEPQGDDSLDTILARMGEPIYDRAFRDRLLRHALYDDEVRQLADAIDALQAQARRLLDIRQRTRVLSSDPRLPLWVLKADHHIGDTEWWAAIPADLREQVRIEAALDHTAIPEELDR
jgi:hypothetical protein